MTNRRTIILLVAVFIVNTILTIIFRDFVREYVLIPILYLIWYFKLFLESLGQTCLWPLLVILLGVVSLRLIRTKQKDRVRERGFSETTALAEEGRVGFWMKYLRRKSMGIENLSFMSYRLRELILSVLAYTENLTSSELEAEVNQGGLVVPEDVRAVISPGEGGGSQITEQPSFISRVLRWFKIKATADRYTSTSDMGKLVQFLEEKLEIEHGDGNQ